MEAEQHQRKLLHLTEMGFDFTEAENALLSANWNIEVAISMLSSQPTSSVNAEERKINSSVSVGVAVEEGLPLLEGREGNPRSSQSPNNDWWSSRWRSYEADRRDELRRRRLEQSSGA